MEITNDKIVLHGKTKETYAEENKAFLEAYDTDDKQIDYYTQKACDIFKEFEIDGRYTFDGVRKSVEIWYKNKTPQFELFRKHPYWSEEAKAIVFLQTEVREVNYEMATSRLATLYTYIHDHYRCDLPIVLAVYRALCDMPRETSPVITEKFLEKFHYHLNSRTEIPKKVKSLLRKGVKITKLVRRCFENIIVRGETVNATTLADEGDPRTRKSFDKYYARFADCLSELAIEKITCVSLHFCDFMTMSNGNSWSSCHFINSHGIFHDGDTEQSYRGAYKLGCLSYALDEPSFILYTLPASYEGNEYYRVQKLNRMCCQYQNGILITGKCYPDNDDKVITRYRQMMQLVISECEKFPNLWTFSKKTSRIKAFVNTSEDSAHYRDYECSGQKPTISLHRPVDIDIDNAMVIGHQAYCLYCGADIYNAGYLQCEYHQVNKVCYICGKDMNDHHSEYYEYDGHYYCADHVFWCDYHSSYEPITEKHGLISMHDGDKTVCKRALNDVVRCHKCGKYIYLFDVQKVDGNSYCTSCYDELPRCSGCGRRISNAEHEHCEFCLSMRELGLNIKVPKKYRVGDYVLLKEHLSSRKVYVNTEMRTFYPNRIVRLTHNITYNDNFNVSKLDGSCWEWATDLFAGVVENCKDEWIGLTPQEVAERIRQNEN